MKNSEKSETLSQAANLVEKGWCQGVNARDKNGKYVDDKDTSAVCFSATGAVDAVAENRDFAYLSRKDFRHILHVCGGYFYESMQAFNDDPRRTKDEVVTMLRKAADYYRRESCISNIGG